MPGQSGTDSSQPGPLDHPRSPRPVVGSCVIGVRRVIFRERYRGRLRWLTGSGRRTVHDGGRILCGQGRGTGNVRLEMARVRGSHDVLPSHAYWRTTSRVAPGFSLSRTNSDVAAARTVQVHGEQSGALGVVPDSSRVVRSAGWSA